MTTANQPPASGLVEVSLKPNFFQSSSFFPVPVVLATTTSAEGQGNIAPYSLLFPLLEDETPILQMLCRTTSKTAQNIRDTGLITLNFVRDEPRFVDEMRRLALPALSADKVGSTFFTLHATDNEPATVGEAFQIYVCERLAEHRVDGPREDNNHCFVLRVRRILMQPYWRQALDDGLGVPHMPIDFGFRAPTSAWLNRPSTNRVLPRLRPRFELPTPLAADVVLARLERALDRPGARVGGYRMGGHVRLFIPEDQRTTWSPQLELDVKDEPETAVFGRLGPHPNVWTMFMAMHGVVGLCGLGALVFGVSQIAANEPGWALWGVPIALFLHLFIAGAAFIGQGLAADETHRLRSFLEDALT